MIPITVMMSKLGLANMWGLVILYLTYAIPQTLFLYVGYIKISVPDSLDEAAKLIILFYNLSSNHLSNAEAHACYNLDYQCSGSGMKHIATVDSE